MIYSPATLIARLFQILSRILKHRTSLFNSIYLPTYNLKRGSNNETCEYFNFVLECHKLNCATRCKPSIVSQICHSASPREIRKEKARFRSSCTNKSCIRSIASKGLLHKYGMRFLIITIIYKLLLSFHKNIYIGN